MYEVNVFAIGSHKFEIHHFDNSNQNIDTKWIRAVHWLIVLYSHPSDINTKLSYTQSSLSYTNNLWW